MEEYVHKTKAYILFKYVLFSIPYIVWPHSSVSRTVSYLWPILRGDYIKFLSTFFIYINHAWHKLKQTNYLQRYNL